jgi:hypothetical protein
MIPYTLLVTLGVLHFCVMLFLLQCYLLGVENMEHLSGEELHTPDSFLVIFNGLILGKHRRPQVLLVCLLSYVFIIYYLIQICVHNYFSFIVNLNVYCFSVLLLHWESCGELVSLASLWVSISMKSRWIFLLHLILFPCFLLFHTLYYFIFPSSIIFLFDEFSYLVDVSICVFIFKNMVIVILFVSIVHFYFWDWNLNIIEWVEVYKALVCIYRLILLNAKSRTKEIVNTLMLIIVMIMLLMITYAILLIFTTIAFHCQ